MAFRLSAAIGWVVMLMLAAIALATVSPLTEASTDAASTARIDKGDDQAAAAAIPILALEKGSTLSIKLKAFSADGETSTTATTTDNEEEEEDDEDVHSFPGIYTANYSYETSRSKTIASNGNNENWLHNSDVIRIECDESAYAHSNRDVVNGMDENVETADDEKIKTDNNDHNQTNRDESNGLNFQSCKGHLLIRSEEEYEDIGSKIRLNLESGQADNIPSRKSKDREPNSPSLHSLDYNSKLTKRWVHQRMKVAEETVSSESRHLRQSTQQQQQQSPNEKGNEEQKRSLLRSRSSEANRDRNDVLFRNIDYSTIRSYDCYYDYQGTMDWIQDFLARYNNNNPDSSSLLEVTWTDIGDSWKKTKSEDEGYDIFALTITGKSKKETSATTASSTTASSASTFQRASSGDTGTEDKAPFLLVSSTHAREYTPPVLVRKWLEHLIEKMESGDEAYISMLEHTKIHWIPYLNPDARMLAETTQPLRRKNLNNEWTGNTGDSAICSEDSYGVDLNRNCPFEWGKPDGSSTYACSSVSRGSRPGSEPEIQALVKYGSKIFPAPQIQSNALVAGGQDYWIQHIPGFSVERSSTKWRGFDPQTTKGVFVDVHSYGKVYIYPWGNLNSISPNDISFRSAMGHIESLTGLDPLGAGPNHYGVASGAADDWAYGVLGAFSMTWELGSDFQEPCDDFEEQYEKHFGAFRYLAQIAPFPFALGRGPILVDIKAQHETIALYYLSGILNENDLFWDYSISNNDNATIREEFDEVGPSTSSTATKEVVRMGTNTVFDLGESIDMVVKLKLPEIIPTDENPIQFDFDETADSGNSANGEETQGNEEPSSVSKIRVFFGGGNPLVGAETAGSTFDANLNSERGSSKYYSEMKVSSGDGGGSRSNEHIISITKNQLWEAFGDKDDPEVFTEHMLYFQAMDNVGNLGPIDAIRLRIAVLKETEGYDDDEGGVSDTAPVVIPEVPEESSSSPPTLAPQSSSTASRFTSPPRPAFNWSEKTSIHEDKRDENSKAEVKSASLVAIDEYVENDGTYDAHHAKEKVVEFEPELQSLSASNIAGGLSSSVKNLLSALVVLVLVVL